MTGRSIREEIVEIFNILKTPRTWPPQQTDIDAIDAARYRKLRQHFKNHEASLELWGFKFKGQNTVGGEDDLDEFCDQSIAAEKEQANGQ